jgi:general stress protein 26
MTAPRSGYAGGMSRTAITENEAPDRRVEDVLDGVRVAMLTTESADGLDARPLTIVEQTGDTLWFLVSRSAQWLNATSLSGQDSLLAFEDAAHSSYVCLTGRLRLDDEPSRIEALWTAPARAYFDGPRDPDVVALAFDVRGGRWWDGPDSRIGQSLALARAIVTHDRSKVGETGAVATGALVHADRAAGPGRPCRCRGMTGAGRSRC